MNSSSIAEYVAELEKTISELLKENSKLKEDRKRIKSILGVTSQSMAQSTTLFSAENADGPEEATTDQADGPEEATTVQAGALETDDIELSNLFDEYVRLNGPAADLPEDEKFMSYHISDVLYWIAEKHNNLEKRRLCKAAAGSIYNLNHEIFSGAEALEIFKRTEILSQSLSFSKSVAQKIDKYLKMPKTT